MLATEGGASDGDDGGSDAAFELAAEAEADAKMAEVEVSVAEKLFEERKSAHTKATQAQAEAQAAAREEAHGAAASGGTIPAYMRLTEVVVEGATHKGGSQQRQVEQGGVSAEELQKMAKPRVIV
jgi:hypothetical protein